MALTFGKINRAASFNPTTAFPLDARSYFESYELAVAAALTAKEAGDTTTVHYFGETLCVVENGAAKLYIIQPDCSLKEAGSADIQVDENAFVYNDNLLSLLGLADAEAGAQLVKSVDGKVSWVKPDASTVEGLELAVTTLQQNVVDLSNNKANAADVYNKEETDLAIATAVADADHLTRKIVDNVDAEIAAPELAEKNVIYMVKVDGSTGGDAYKEYMRFDAEDGTVSFEQIGDTSIDLTDYVKSDALSALLANKADVSTTDNLALLIQANTEALNLKASADDLNTLSQTVDSHGQDIAALQTALGNKADASAVESLTELVNQKANASDLNNKVDKVFSEVNGEQVPWGLLSPTDANKLNQLTLNDDGSISINASNISGLAQLITDQRNTIPGLFSAENQSKLDAIEANAQENIIEAIKLAGESNNLIVENKTVEIPYATKEAAGLVKLSDEIQFSTENQLEIKSLNVNKLVQTEDLLLNCGGSAEFIYK